MRKLYGRNDFGHVIGKEKVNKIFSSIGEQDRSKIESIIKLFEKCQPKVTNKKRYKDKNAGIQVIHDPCYRYSRRAKETFFRNP